MPRSLLPSGIITWAIRIPVNIQKPGGLVTVSLGSQTDAAHGNLATSEGLVVPWQLRWIREGLGFRVRG